MSCAGPRLLLAAVLLSPSTRAMAAAMPAAEMAGGLFASGVLWPLLGAGLALLAFYGFWRRRLALQQVDALNEELAALQGELDRTELLLMAEPQVLLLWELAPSAPDDEKAPSPPHGDEHNATAEDENLSEDAASSTSRALSLPDPEVFVHPQLVDTFFPDGQDPAQYEQWLEEDAAADLRRRLRELHATGAPFNISLRMASGELIEADGRVAGRLLMLRFRPLYGERLEALVQTHDQRQLKQQAQRLTRLLAGAPVPLWMTSPEGTLQWANETWLELMGYDTLEAARAEEACLPGKAERAAAKELPPVGPWQRYVAAVIISGQRRHFEIWEREHDRGMVHWARDISEQVELREELQRRKAAQNRIFDQLSTALAIFDAEQRLVFHNAAYARLWGLDEEWLARQPREEEVLNRLYDAGRLQLTEDFPQWRRQWLDIYHQQETRRVRWQLAGGQMVQVIAEPQPGEGVIYMFEDITEHLRLEARYREALQVQEETLDNLHEAVAVFGTDGRLRLFNHTFSQLWQLDENHLQMRPHVDDIIAQCREQVVQKDFWDEVKFGVTAVAEDRKPFSGRVNHVDGRVFDYLAVPLPDGNMLITWYDTTDAVRAERALRERAAALEESDRAKAAFLDSISYDLRTPLTTINGYTEMLQAGYAGPLADRQKEFLRHVQEASAELLEKIDTILDLAAIDAGKMTLDIGHFEVLPMLEELANGIATRLEQRDMSLEIELAEDVRDMRGDRARIMQALRHLLLNAIGFGHKGTVVRMGARRDDAGNVHFWVADSGPGMNAELMKRAFERFFARPSPEGHRGPGLGLPLVKALVELHGGEVELHSREGRGTTVICKLPQPEMAEQQA